MRYENKENPHGVKSTQKSLEIFDKSSTDKVWSKKGKKMKVSPFMLNLTIFFFFFFHRWFITSWATNSRIWAWASYRTSYRQWNYCPSENNLFTSGEVPFMYYVSTCMAQNQRFSRELFVFSVKTKELLFQH